MARVKGNVLDNLSGKLGNLSARTRYGQTILGARPSSFKVSNSPGSLVARAFCGRVGDESPYAACLSQRHTGAGRQGQAK